MTFHPPAASQPPQRPALQHECNIHEELCLYRLWDYAYLGYIPSAQECMPGFHLQGCYPNTTYILDDISHNETKENDEQMRCIAHIVLPEEQMGGSTTSLFNPSAAEASYAARM